MSVVQKILHFIEEKKYVFLGIIILGGIYFQSMFLGLNEILKVADSFAYLQMARFLNQFSVDGLGTGWFGFVYSIPIALGNIFIQDPFLSAKIVNLLLLACTGILLFQLASKILSPLFSLAAVGIYFLSPSSISFTIHVLSENIYIPFFLFLVLQSFLFLENINKETLQKTQKRVILIACTLGFLYLTRAEAFIYIISIGILSFYLLATKKIGWKKFFGLGILFFLSFFLFISPYIFHLHSLTGEWGLTNKGASNLRQAELRGTQKMDDAGFEQAVAELTQDKTQLIAGFAGGMPYTKPIIPKKEKDSNTFYKSFQRMMTNQWKLYTKNIPEIFLGKSPELYSSTTKFIGQNIFFLLWVLSPLIILLIGISICFRYSRSFFIVTCSFFIPASIFFTIFFTLNRYFIIFLPLWIVFFTHAIFHLSRKSRWYILLFLPLITTLLLSNVVYYNSEKQQDNFYALKKTAGLWLKEQVENPNDLKIMERFPIVTYYAGADWRYITPYTNSSSDIQKYAHHHSLQYLVVDSMDFKKYRPELGFLLETSPKEFILIKEFTSETGEKVRIFQIP